MSTNEAIKRKNYFLDYYSFGNSRLSYAELADVIFLSTDSEAEILHLTEMFHRANNERALGERDIHRKKVEAESWNREAELMCCQMDP